MCRNWGDTAKGVYALSYCVRLMTRDDIPRVSMLDREIFPSMKMHTNFQNELKNCLAYYIVVYKKGEASGCVAGVNGVEIGSAQDRTRAREIGTGAKEGHAAEGWGRHALDTARKDAEVTTRYLSSGKRLTERGS